MNQAIDDIEREADEMYNIQQSTARDVAFLREFMGNINRKLDAFFLEQHEKFDVLLNRSKKALCTLCTEQENHNGHGTLNCPMVKDRESVLQKVIDKQLCQKCLQPRHTEGFICQMKCSLCSKDHSILICTKKEVKPQPSEPRKAQGNWAKKAFHPYKKRLSENSEFFKNLFEEEVKELNETMETEKEEVKPKKKSSFKLLRGCFKTPVEVEIEEAQEQKEDPVKEIELKDLSADEFGDFLKLFYPGDFNVNALNYQSLASMSLRFGTPKGINLCQSFVMYNFTEFDVIEMIEFAVKYEMEDIKHGNIISVSKFDGSRGILDFYV